MSDAPWAGDGPASGAEPAGVPTPSRLPFHLGLWLVGGLFVWAGALKIGDPKAFAKAILEYQLVPEGLAPAMGVLLPGWEITAGGLAVAGVWRRGALMVMTGFAAVFFAAGAVTLARGLSPTCACFGALSGRVGPMTALMELGLLILCGLLLREEIMRSPVPGPPPPGRGSSV